MVNNSAKTVNTRADWMVSKNFKLSEVCCKHCGAHAMKRDFISLVQEFRDFLGAPVVITSGYRCRLHPVGSAPPSQCGRQTQSWAGD
jgi:hypothetical protein